MKPPAEKSETTPGWFHFLNFSKCKSRDCIGSDSMGSIMSSLSQEESRSISENTMWGRRKAFSDGKYSLAYKNFLGYDKGPDGKLVINPEQAEVVWLIYRLFLDGLSATAIAKELTNRGIKTMTGKEKWSAYVVNYALGNEKYAGSALLQKKFTESFLTKKQIKNAGQIPQYFVEDDHPAIIDKRTWKLVQAERQLRQQKGKGSYSGTCIFSSKIKCGDCGGWYGSKIWHSNDQYRRRVWQCNRKYEGKKCTTTHLTDDEIKELFVKALNNILKEKDEIVSNLGLLLQDIPDTFDLEKEAKEAAAEKDVLAEMVDKAIEENASKAQDQEEYEKNFSSLMERYESQKKKCDDLAVQIARLKAKKRQMENFIETVGHMDGCISEFDERLWGSLVDHLTVYNRKRIVFTFKGGQETTVSMD